MSTRENLTLRTGSSRHGSNVNDLPAAGLHGSDGRAIPEGLRQFLAWDAEITTKVTSFFEKSFPNVTKSETKFMEVYYCLIINYSQHFLIPYRFQEVGLFGFLPACSCISCPSGSVPACLQI